MSKPLSPADRLALALCRAIGDPGPCHPSQICNGCREQSAAVAHEIARQLRERHGGSSQVADWLDGVGCHPPETVQTVQETMSDTLKPPLGLRPRWVAETLRIQEILEAMYRYSQASFPIPQDWVDELSNLAKRELIREDEKLGARLARHPPETVQTKQGVQ